MYDLSAVYICRFVGDISPINRPDIPTDNFFLRHVANTKKNMSADVLLYDLRHAGYGLSKSTALGFASKSIKTCNVQGCELTRKRWEGVSDFRPYNDLINNVQTIKCESLIF